jgi:GDP-L-fucose synthase
MDKMAKIYIAGHTGLVGSALVKALKNKGYKNIIGKTIQALDLRDPSAVKTFFEAEKPEYVILAAAKVGGIVANNTYRGEFIYDNLMIQNNVIHQSYLSGVKKLLFLGSTCIYPKKCPQPMKEEYLLTSPLEYTNEPYAIAKIAGIKMCESYNIQYGTNFLSVMPTNLYGPYDNFDLEKSHVLPALIRKIHLGKCLQENNWDAIRRDLTKRPIEEISGESGEEEILQILNKFGIRSQKSKVKSQRSVDFKKSETEDLESYELLTRNEVSVESWGSGKPLREFLWSEEMADACIFLMENINYNDVKPPNPSKSAQSMSVEIRNTHINIGTGKEISIHDLAHFIKEKIGFKGDLMFNTGKPDGTMRKLTDPSILHKLGWKHQIEIEEGVDKMYEWYQSDLNAKGYKSSESINENSK